MTTRHTLTREGDIAYVEKHPQPQCSLNDKSAEMILAHHLLRGGVVRAGRRAAVGVAVCNVRAGSYGHGQARPLRAIFHPSIAVSPLAPG